MNTATTQPSNAISDQNSSNRRISSQSLLAGAKEILIQHADQVYRLRETRNGKLIMHK